MEKAIWQLQQEAEQRVRRMQEQSRRLVEAEHHRTAQTLAAAAEAVAAMPRPAPSAPPAPSGDGAERALLLLLAWVLYQNGANRTLLLMLLYLAA